MGLEWHNRKRSPDGRFARQERKLGFHSGIHYSQLHIRVPRELGDRIRHMALLRHVEINELCCRFLDESCSRMEKIR